MIDPRDMSHDELAAEAIRELERMPKKEQEAVLKTLLKRAAELTPCAACEIISKGNATSIPHWCNLYKGD